MPTYCPDCGEPLSSDQASFCTECGSEIGSHTSSSTGGGEDEGRNGFSEKVPGMRPGSTIRNIAVGCVWGLAILVVVSAVVAVVSDGFRSTSHEVGDTFIVGDGSQSVEYTITDATTQDEVGKEIFTEEADGEFVVIELEMTNVGDESFLVSRSSFSLVDSEGTEFDTDSDALLRVESNVIAEQLDPQVTKTGVLIFDVPADKEGWTLRIEPAGMFSNADTHTVEIG